MSNFRMNWSVTFSVITLSMSRTIAFYLPDTSIQIKRFFWNALERVARRHAVRPSERCGS